MDHVCRRIERLPQSVDPVQLEGSRAHALVGLLLEQRRGDSASTPRSAVGGSVDVRQPAAPTAVEAHEARRRGCHLAARSDPWHREADLLRRSVPRQCLLISASSWAAVFACSMTTSAPATPGNGRHRIRLGEATPAIGVVRLRLARHLVFVPLTALGITEQQCDERT